MKKTLIIFAVVIGAVAFSSKVSAQGLVTNTTNTADCEILTPITLVANNNLQFGKMAPAASIQTLVIGTDLSFATTTVASSGLQLMSGTTRTAAKYTATGTPDAQYNIIVPSGTIALSDGNSHTIDVDNFTYVSENPVLNGGKLSGLGGTDIFYVGARLTIGAAQVSGSYTATFPVSISYQ